MATVSTGRESLFARCVTSTSINIVGPEDYQTPSPKNEVDENGGGAGGVWTRDF